MRIQCVVGTRISCEAHGTIGYAFKPIEIDKVPLGVQPFIVRIPCVSAGAIPAA